MYFVYVLQSIPTGKLYIGSSSDPERRLVEHNYGKTITEALHREHQIKKSGKIRQGLKNGTYTASSFNG